MPQVANRLFPNKISVLMKCMRFAIILIFLITKSQQVTYELLSATKNLVVNKPLSGP